MTGRVPRFNRTQRTLHWLHALSFLALLGTGLILYLPPLASSIGHRALLRQLHLWSAGMYLLGPILVARLGNWKSVRAEIQEIDRWEPGDLRWLRRFGRRLPHGDETGRFNAGQKLNSIFTGAAALLLGASGLIMWKAPFFPRWLGQNAILLHDSLTWLALAVWLGHVYLSVLHPSTRESLRGIVLGWVNAEWAREHHPKWYNNEVTADTTSRKNE